MVVRTSRKHAPATLPEAWHNLQSLSPTAANSILTAVTNLFLASIGMISGVLAARMLGPRGRGELAAIQSWPTFVATVAMLGMPEAIVYYSARDQSKAGRYLGSGMATALISSVPFALVSYLLMPVMLRAQTPAIVSAGQWYLLLIPLYASVGMLVHPLRGLSDFAPWNLMRLMPNTLWIGTLALAWKLSRETPAFVAGANLVALSLLILPFGGLVIWRVPGPFVPDLRKLPPMLTYGIPCMMTSVPLLLNLRLDQMLMAALLPARELGLYVVAVAWSGAPLPLLNALGSVTAPAVASVADPAQGIHRLATASKITVVLGIVVCTIMTLATPWAIVILFGRQFAAASRSAVVLVGAAGMLGLNFVLQEGLRGIGHPYAALKAELAGFLVTALMLFVTLQRMGIMGAALSSLLGYSTVAAVAVVNLKRYAEISPRALLLSSPSEVRFAIDRMKVLLRGMTSSPSTLP